MRILVTDDSITMRRIIIKHLKDAGYDDIAEARDGEEALIKLPSVDLMLVDWNMPVMNGMDLVKTVRKKSNNSHVPIIMVTTEGAQSDVLEALKQGVNDYVVKPFTGEVLISKVKLITTTMRKKEE